MKRKLLALAIAFLLAMQICPAPLPVARAETAQTTVLQLGSAGEEVRKLQARLIELELLSGGADGDFGKNTKRAVEEFQARLQAKGYEMTIDGVAGPQTLKLIYDDEIAELLSKWTIGDRGSLIWNLQASLIELNFLGGDPDGSFGEQTAAAVKAFQQVLIDHGAQGITADGVADKATRKKLSGDLSGLDIKAPKFFDDQAPQSLTDEYLYAWSCLLLDADTGEVLYAKDADARRYPASTTKIMTLMVALENGKPSATVTVPASAGEIPADSSRVPVYPGESMTLGDLLFGLMIQSGNDAANAIAELTCGSVEKFVAKMNEKAAALGLRDTRYANPHGYHDAEHYTTARDMAKLTREALKSKGFLKVIKARSYTLPATVNRAELVLKNKYALLDSSSRYYYPYAFGVKTGYTSKAGYCYVGAAEKDGHTLIAVLLHSGLYQTNKWVDAKRLFRYGFAKLGVD